MITRQLFKTAEDELNFILGDDGVGQEFDIGGSDLMLDSQLMDPPVLEDFQDFDLDDILPEKLLYNGCETRTNLGQNVHGRFNVSLPLREQLNLPPLPPCSSAATNAWLNSKTAADVASELNSNNATDSSCILDNDDTGQQLDIDIANSDLILESNFVDLPVQEDLQDFDFDEIVKMLSNDREPLTNLGLNSHDHCKPSSKRKRQSVSSGRTCCEGLDPTATSVKASEARLARRNRRRLRAKNQAINLVGGGDVSSIRRRAVADSAKLDPSLLSDFSRNFDPKLYVDVTFEHAYNNMVEAGETKKAAEAEASLFETKSSNDMDGLDRTARPQCMQISSNTSICMQRTKATKSTYNDHNDTQTPPPASTEAAAIPTYASRHNKRRKSLPSGKDAESRKLRRLMRNRISAQASRDRRKKAIEDARRIKAEKDNEIKALQKTVWEETQHMMQLAKAIEFARDYLGPDKYSKVGAPPGSSLVVVPRRNSRVAPAA